MITDIEDTINNGIMHSRESESCVAQPELKAVKKKWVSSNRERQVVP